MSRWWGKYNFPKMRAGDGRVGYLASIDEDVNRVSNFGRYSPYDSLLALL